MVALLPLDEDLKHLKLHRRAGAERKYLACTSTEDDTQPQPYFANRELSTGHWDEHPELAHILCNAQQPASGTGGDRADDNT